MSDDYAGPGVPSFGSPVVDCPHFGRLLEFDGECTVCSGAERRLAEQQTAEPRVFVAKWPGQCGVCNLPIVEGQMIAWREGQPVVHEGCAS